MASHAPPLATDPDVYRTLVESTRAIPWAIDWASKRFEYIGPQIEALLGWTPASWASVHDWVERMHGDDRQRVFDFCVAQSLAGVDHEADYRALRADGGYVWIRDVVHVVRGADGAVVRLVGFMFDITERKRAEEQLAELQRTLERYSYQDGLTGVANRRMVDRMLEREWDAARRTGEPLSLVLLDIDRFKQFNDRYGHLRGDECLRGIAQALQAQAGPRDLAGRFGGEEFILLLPGADAEAARTVAERCREAVAAMGRPHADGVGGRVSLSAGVATAVPAMGGDALELLRTADRHLYRAKQGGRDRVIDAEPVSAFPG